MPDSPFNVEIEWIIENFDCWVIDVHGATFESPEIPFFPGFKALLQSCARGNVDVFELYCDFGEQGYCDGHVSVLFADHWVVTKVHIEDSGCPVNLWDGLQQDSLDDSDCGKQVTFRFQFIADRPDIVRVGMSTTVEVLYDTSATFYRSELLANVSSCLYRHFFPIRFVRPDGKGNEEEASLMVSCRNPNDMALLLISKTKWSFSHLHCKFRWDAYDTDNEIIDRIEKCSFAGGLRNCGAKTFMLVVDWDSYVHREFVSHFRLRITFLTGKIRGAVKAGGVWKRKTLGFIPKDDKRSSKPPRRGDHVAHHQDENWANLRKELMSAYQNKLYTDFELRCAGKTMEVHRAILSARSPVFKSMLSHDMIETASGSVDIEDMDFATVEQFVAFLYTGAVDDLQVESAMKLYYAADKYEVSTLKTECSLFLTENVSVSNACDVLLLADRHGDARLTSSVQKFILRNFRDVSRSEEWKSYTLTNPELLAETVTCFASPYEGHFSDIFSEYIGECNRY